MAALESVTTGTTGTTMTTSTAVDHAQVRQHVLRSAQAAGRRLSPGVAGGSAASFTIARPLEYPTRLRVSWAHADEGRTDVRITVRHSAGMSAGTRRIIDRFLGLLSAELGLGDSDGWASTR